MTLGMSAQLGPNPPLTEASLLVQHPYLKCSQKTATVMFTHVSINEKTTDSANKFESSSSLALSCDFAKVLLVSGLGLLLSGQG